MNSVKDRSTLSKVAVLIPSEVRTRIFPASVLEELATFSEPLILSDDVLADERLPSQLAGVPAVITGWQSPALPTEVLAPSGSVGFVSHAAGSVKRLGLNEALQSGHVRVSHAAPEIAHAVAEFTITQILAHLRRHRDLDAGFRTGQSWAKIRSGNLGQLLRAQSVGIVGLGYVGRLVLNLLRPFGCRVLVYDPFLDNAQARELGVELSDLEGLFSRCTIVSLHAANLPETTGMITRTHLESLRPGGLLVNTARAGLIAPGAMIEVLCPGQIFAALDTFDSEPLPENDMLRQLKNVYLSPHYAGHTVDSYIRQGCSAVEEVRRYLFGQPLKQEILREKAGTLA